MSMSSRSFRCSQTLTHFNHKCVATPKNRGPRRRVASPPVPNGRPLFFLVFSGLLSSYLSSLSRGVRAARVPARCGTPVLVPVQRQDVPVQTALEPAHYLREKHLAAKLCKANIVGGVEEQIQLLTRQDKILEFKLKQLIECMEITNKISRLSVVKKRVVWFELSDHAILLH